MDKLKPSPGWACFMLARVGACPLSLTGKEGGAGVLHGEREREREKQVGRKREGERETGREKERGRERNR